MKANPDKCHLLVSSDESCTDKIEDFSIKKSTKEIKCSWRKITLHGLK